MFVNFCYYIVLGLTVVLALYKLGASDQLEYKFILEQYLLCSSSGKSNDCKEYKDRIEALTTVELSMAAYIFLGLYPAVNLFYAVQVKKMFPSIPMSKRHEQHVIQSQQTITTVANSNV